MYFFRNISTVKHKVPFLDSKGLPFSFVIIRRNQRLVYSFPLFFRFLSLDALLPIVLAPGLMCGFRLIEIALRALLLKKMKRS